MKETKAEEVKRRKEEIGVPVTCSVCYMQKQPIGRSAAPQMASGLCDQDCDGYRDDPKPGELWPGESRHDFGYPKPLHK